MKSFKTREIGIYETADRLNGRASCEGSETITYLNPVPATERPRKLKKYSIIQRLNDNDTDIFHNNVIDSYYPNRPACLEKLCLYDFVSQYDFLSKQCSHFNKPHAQAQCHQLQNNFGYICYRFKTKLVKLSTVKVFDPKTTEKYFHHMLISFKPWRIEDEVKGEFDSYQEAFTAATRNEHTNNLFTQYVDKKKRIEAAIKFCNKISTDALSSDEETTSGPADISVELTDSQDRLLNLGVTDLPHKYLSKSTLNKYESELNIQQREIYDEILNHISHQEQHNLDECQCQVRPPGIRRFISGVAGKIKILLYLRKIFCINYIE